MGCYFIHDVQSYTTPLAALLVDLLNRSLVVDWSVDNNSVTQRLDVNFTAYGLRLEFAASAARARPRQRSVGLLSQRFGRGEVGPTVGPTDRPTVCPAKINRFCVCVCRSSVCLSVGGCAICRIRWRPKIGYCAGHRLLQIQRIVRFQSLACSRHNIISSSTATTGGR